MLPGKSKVVVKIISLFQFYTGTLRSFASLGTYRDLLCTSCCSTRRRAKYLNMENIARETLFVWQFSGTAKQGRKLCAFRQTTKMAGGVWQKSLEVWIGKVQDRLSDFLSMYLTHFAWNAKYAIAIFCMIEINLLTSL